MASFRSIALMSLVVAGIAGCDDENARVAEVAREAANRQAEQNKVMADLQTHMTSLQQDVQKSQVEVGRQRDLLEGERREIAAQRHRDPIIAAVLMDVGLVLACLAPLVLALYVLRSLGDAGQTESAMTEVLITELVADKPLFLPPPKSAAAIAHHAEPTAEEPVAIV